MQGVIKYVIYLYLTKKSLAMIKNRLYSSLLFIFIYSCLLSISCCKPDDPCKGTPSQTNKYYISDDNKSKIPYSDAGFDTMVFINNTDTAKLLGQGKQQTMSMTSNYSSSNPDCGNMNYYYYEDISLNFMGNNTELPDVKLKVYAQDGKQGNEVTSIVIGGDISKIYSDFINNESNYNDSIYSKGNYYSGFNLYGVNEILYSRYYGILRIKLNGKTWIRYL
jgi:hypothetical protein